LGLGPPSWIYAFKFLISSNNVSINTVEFLDPENTQVAAGNVEIKGWVDAGPFQLVATKALTFRG